MKHFFVGIFLILSIIIFAQERQLNRITITDLKTNTNQVFMFYYEENRLIQINNVVYSEHPPFWETILFEYDSNILENIILSGPWNMVKYCGIKYSDNTTSCAFQEISKESDPVSKEIVLPSNSEKNIILFKDSFMVPDGKYVSNIKYLVSSTYNEVILKYSISSSIDSESQAIWITPTTADIVEGNHTIFKLQKTTFDKNTTEYDLIDFLETESKNILKIKIEYKDCIGNTKLVI